MTAIHILRLQIIENKVYMETYKNKNKELSELMVPDIISMKKKLKILFYNNI